MVKKTIAAAMLSALALVPMPASAQVNFGFHFGDEPRDFYPQLPICLTDHQIRQAIARRGYTNIALNVPNEKRIQVRATQDGWVYLIDFDFCADRIRGQKALRPAG
ncbi:MAG: hypothetical protein ABW043_21555 [Devosia sp.]|uniref:hypothetical protein n=1 Tax=Devosia sp. TaxID=1871048 RepID=UPI003399EFB3